MFFKKPLKVAAWSYIILLPIIILSFLLLVSGIKGYLVFILVFILSPILISLFVFLIYNGFAELGRKFNSNFLIFTSYIIAGITIISILYWTYLFISSEEIILDIVMKGFNPFFTQILSFLLSILIFLFGIALFRLGDKVALARSTGILIIIGGVLSVFGAFLAVGVAFSFLGFLISFAVVVMEIVLLFKASAKFER